MIRPLTGSGRLIASVFNQPHVKRAKRKALSIQHFLDQRNSYGTLTLSDAYSTYSGRYSDFSPSEEKLSELKDRLDFRLSRPSRIWHLYNELLQLCDPVDVPLKVHQHVLRRCVKDTEHLRSAFMQNLQSTKRYPIKPHLYQERFEDVLENIRYAGWTPDLEDFHYILEQYAAVAHYKGAFATLQSMSLFDVTPSSKTYGLCLLAIARRLSMPCNVSYREKLPVECGEMAIQIMRQMEHSGIVVQSVNLDIAMSIMKDCGNLEGFERILKNHYGIDLDYPDRHPFEVSQSDISTIAEEEDLSDLSFMPISTPMLNNILDFLGSQGKLSKMVQTYEVLTAPLPQTSRQASTGFEDEDEDYYTPLSSDHSPPIPSVQPNTSTHNILLRYAVKARHTVFARHYLLNAMHHDRTTNARLFEDLASRAADEIKSPQVSIRQNTLKIMYGYANRSGDLGLLRWLRRQLRNVLGWKRRDLSTITVLLGIMPPSDARTLRRPIEAVRPASTPARTPTSDTASSPDRVKLSPQQSSPSHTDRHGPAFNLTLHTKLLTQDIVDLMKLRNTLDRTILRVSERMKRKLRRRTIRGKNIFVPRVQQRSITTEEELNVELAQSVKISNDSKSGVLSSKESESPHS